MTLSSEERENMCRVLTFLHHLVNSGVVSRVVSEGQSSPDDIRHVHDVVNDAKYWLDRVNGDD